jgi:carboxyl-terminal processing protease
MFKGKLFSGAMMVLVVFVLLLGINQFRSGSQVYAAKSDKFTELENFSQALDMVKARYVEDVNDQEIMEGAIKGMLRELDPHSTYFTPDEYKSFMVDMEGSFGGLGMTVGMRDNMVIVVAPIEDTPAHRAGIKSGDIIYKIDNESTADMDTDAAVKLMRGKPGTSVTLTIVRAGEAEPLVFDLVRDIIKVKSVKSNMVSGDIAYVRLTNFQKDSGKEVQAALESLDKEGSKGIIFDLRINPGGSLEEAIYVSSLFLPARKPVVSVKGREENSTLSTRNVSFREETKPLVVLVDEGSASASEIVAGAVQDYARGVILGTTTFGKASVQTIFELDGGGAMKLTTARYYTPNGRSIQGVGIVPDVVVPRGKIVYSENSFMVKESDLAGHLVGENEGQTQAAGNAGEEDLQLQSAIQLIKGLTLYGNK